METNCVESNHWLFHILHSRIEKEQGEENLHNLYKPPLLDIDGVSVWHQLSINQKQTKKKPMTWQLHTVHLFIIKLFMINMI